LATKLTLRNVCVTRWIKLALLGHRLP